MRTIITLLALLLVSAPTLANTANQPQLTPSSVSIEAFFKRNQFENMVLSPDGKHLAVTFVEESDPTSTTLAIMDIGLTKILSSFNFGEFRRIGAVRWPRNDRIMFSYAKFVGFLDTRGEPPVYVAYDLDGKNGRQITVPINASYSIVSLLPNKPNKILVSKRSSADATDRQGDGNEAAAKLFEIDIDKGKEDYIATEPPGVTQIIADTSGNPRVAIGYMEKRNDKLNYGTYTAFVKKTPTSAWAEMETSKFYKEDGARADVRLLGFNSDSTVAYISTDYASDLPAIYSVDMATLEYTKLTQLDKVTLGSSIRGVDGALYGYWTAPDYNRKLYLGENNPMEKMMKQLYASFGVTQEDVDINVTSMSKDENLVVLNVDSDRDPGAFYLFNRGLDGSKPSISELAVSKKEIDPALMADMVPFEFESRDGVALNGYYVLPTVGEAPFPMVQIIHGGPHGPRDFWGWNREAQFLASRGYAVVQVNFRGSGGYGSAFEQSGYHEWGGKMINDMTDATMWMIDKGFADKDRMCVYGGSYGGYGTLQSVVREPDLYKCAIGYVGVYSLFEMKRAGDIPKRRSGRKYLDMVLSTDEALMTKFSPALNTDKIKAELFIAHGREDVRVPMEQYDALSDNLKKVGKDYKSMVRDEGHGYQQMENIVDFYTAMETFLADNLKK